MRYDIIYVVGFFISFMISIASQAMSGKSPDEVDFAEEVRKAIFWPVFFFRFVMIQLVKLGETFFNNFVN